MRHGTQPKGRRFGTIRQLPSGRFQAGWRGPDRHMHKAPDTFATKPEAETWLARVRVERAEGTHIDDRLGAVTFAAFAAQWRATVVHLRRSSLKRDLEYVDRYLLPTFGSLALAEIDHPAVAAWVSEMNARGLAPATVVKAAQILAKILDLAIRARLIHDNPARGLKLPKIEKAPKRALSVPEVARLVAAFDPRYRSLVIVGCHTGLRFGELAALTAADVDLLRRRLTVRRNVIDLGQLELSNVKTAAGRRVVPLDAAALAALAPLVGSVSHPDDLIWEAPRGGFIRLNSWRARFWRRAVKAAGLDPLSPHDMRHTAITAWVRAGIDPTDIAKWAGHRSVVTVLDVYGHARPDDDNAALDRLNAYHAAQPAGPAPATITALGGPRKTN